MSRGDKQAVAHRSASGAAPDESDALGIATAWLLSTTGTQETQQSLLATRILAHSFEGLRQHLTIRLGTEAAAERLSSLRGQSFELAKDAKATPRALLYRRARKGVGPPSVLEPADALWWNADRSGRYGASLVALRTALSPALWDALELRYARDLTPEEVAWVLDLSVAELDERLRAGLDQAATVLGEGPASRAGTLEGALLEAFALALPPERRFLNRDPIVEEGRVVGGRYRVIELLGSGAFADVYRARDLEVPGHAVALKVFREAFDPQREQSATRELQLIASVFHPSVVQFKDHGQEGGRFWFVMPLYEGETLEQRIASGPLSREEARRIFEPLASALAAMHRAGVRHQDVKPANIFLARLEGQQEDDVLPILLDLGVAARDAEVVIAGTPVYFAPEVASRFADIPDPPPLSDKSDVFSLALSLRNVLEPGTREGVVGGNVNAFIAQRATQAPRAPSAASLAFLKPFFDRWLHLSPDERPGAAQLGRELAQLTLPEERRARRRRVLRWLLPLMLTVAAVCASIVIAVTREAEVQRAEAMRARAEAALEREQAQAARQRAAHIQANLSAEEALRRELQQDVQRLEEQYESSRMTREELAAELGRIEGELTVLEEERKRARARARQAIETLEVERESLRGSVEQLRAESQELGARVRERDGELGALQERLGQLDAAKLSLEQQLRAAQRGEAEARARVADLEDNLSALRRSVDRTASAQRGASR